MITYLRKKIKNKILRKTLKNFSYILAKILYGDKVKIKIGGSYEFFLDSKFAFANYDKWGGQHNIGFNKLLEMAYDKSIVLDIGGHIGLTALPLSKVIKNDGFVYVFEPSDVNRYYLNKHININNIKNIKVYDTLIGDKDVEIVKFHELDDVSGTPSIVNIKKDFKVTQKSQITLDTFCEQNNIKPELIKMDIEGAEFYALRGGKKFISKYKPIILLSLHPKHLQELGEDLEFIFDFLKNINYKMIDCATLKKVNKVEELYLNEYILQYRELDES